MKAQPRGTVLIVASERNPVGSVLCPLVLAVAAGNGVVVHVPAKYPKIAKLLQVYFFNFLDNRYYQCCVAGESNVEKLASLPFDMLFFTGSSEEAKRVQRACSVNLVPSLLEIEASNPIIVDSKCNVSMAAAKIASVKFKNLNTHGASTDSLFVHSSIRDRFATEFRKESRKQYNVHSNLDISNLHASLYLVMYFSSSAT